MIYSEGTEIIYKDLCGIIDFVCESYVVLKMKSDQTRSPPRLLIYRECMKEIKILKESSK